MGARNDEGAFNTLITGINSVSREKSARQFQCIVTSLSPSYAINLSTNSGIPIRAIPLPLLDCSQSIDFIFGSRQITQFIKCESAEIILKMASLFSLASVFSSGHPRSLGYFVAKWDSANLPLIKRLTTVQYLDFVLSALPSEVSTNFGNYSVVRACLIGHPISIQEKITGSDYTPNQLVMSGSLFARVDGNVCIPIMSPAVVYMWATSCASGNHVEQTVADLCKAIIQGSIDYDKPVAFENIMILNCILHSLLQNRSVSIYDFFKSGYEHPFQSLEFNHGACLDAVGLKYTSSHRFSDLNHKYGDLSQFIESMSAEDFQSAFPQGSISFCKSLTSQPGCDLIIASLDPDNPVRSSIVLVEFKSTSVEEKLDGTSDVLDKYKVFEALRETICTKCMKIN